MSESDSTAEFILRETALATLNIARGLKEELDLARDHAGGVGGKVLGAELAALEARLMASASSAREDSALAHELRGSLAEERAKRAALLTTVSELRDELARVERNHAGSQAAAEVLRVQLTHSRASLGASAAHADGLLAELGASRAAASELRAALDSERRESSGVRAAAADTHAELTSARAQLSELPTAAELAELRRSQAASAAAVGTLRAELNAAERTAAAELAAERAQHQSARDDMAAAAHAETRAALATSGRARTSADGGLVGAEGSGGALAEQLRAELRSARGRQAAAATVVDDFHVELQRAEASHARQLAAARRSERAALERAAAAEREVGRLRDTLGGAGAALRADEAPVACGQARCSSELRCSEQRVMKRALAEAATQLSATREHSALLAQQLARANAQLAV